MQKKEKTLYLSYILIVILNIIIYLSTKNYDTFFLRLNFIFPLINNIGFFIVALILKKKMSEFKTFNELLNLLIAIQTISNISNICAYGVISPYAVAYFTNTLVMLSTVFVLFFITGQKRLSINIFFIFNIILGIFNIICRNIRQTPLSINDIKTAYTFTQVASDINFIPNLNNILLIIACVIIFFILLLSIQEKRKFKLKERLFYIIAAISIICGVLVYKHFNENLLDTTEFNSRYNGYGNNILFELTERKIKKPAKYEENLSKMDNYTVTFSEGEQPENVIIIMNEAFSDLEPFINNKISQDYMPYIHSLEKNTIKGWAYSSVYGGMTAQSEFEVLTGSSGLFGKGKILYNYGLKENTPSLVSNLESLGYKTIAFHPADEKNYSRLDAYTALGFDELIFDKDLDDLVTNDGFGHYSDKKCYNKILDEINNNDKLFILNVTLQNHAMYYPSNNDDYYCDNSELNAYLNLIKASDDAFKDFLTQLEECDEKTIVVMFGDHQPALDNKPKYKNNITQVDRIVPYIIWANYDIDTSGGENISLNYLSNLLCKKANLPLSPYQNYLEDLKEKYPVINMAGTIDKDGNEYSNNLKEEYLNTYNSFFYNQIIDESTNEEFYSW